MKSLPIRLVAAGLLSLGSLALTACHDADAATRSEVANTLMKAADDALLAGSNKSALEKIARTLKGIQGATPQQESTRDRLLASTQFHIAVIEIGDIELMDVSISHDLLRLRAMADAALNMSAFASAREQIENQSNTPELAELREQITAKAEEVRQQSAQMDSPVVDTLEQLNAASEDVMRFRRQAERLREQASLTSPMQRYPIIEQAIQNEREADRLEAEMMRKELALDIIHRPDKQKLEKAKADYEAILSEIDAAQHSLNENTRQSAESASKAREDLQAMDSKLTKLSKEISDKVTGELRESYQKATATLQQAQSNARKAGRNGVGRLAKQEQKLLQARIELAQADLGMMQIRGMNEWIRVLDILASNVDLGNRDAWGLQAQEARKQQQTLAQKVSSDLDAAMSTGAGSKTNDSTRAHLEAAKAFVTGNAIPTGTAENASANMQSQAPSSAAEDTSTASNSDASDGFDSPQALVDAMKKVMSGGDLQQMTQFQIDTAYYRDSSTASNAKDSALFGLKAVEIAQAAQKSFGGTLSGPLAMLAQAGEMSKMISSATYSAPTESGDTGSVSISMMGMDMNMPLIKVNGKWFFDGDNAPMASDSQLPNASNLLKIANSILDQIKSGQISDQAQLDAAIEPLNAAFMGG